MHSIRSDGLIVIVEHFVMYWPPLLGRKFLMEEHANNFDELCSSRVNLTVLALIPPFTGSKIVKQVLRDEGQDTSVLSVKTSY